MLWMNEHAPKHLRPLALDIYNPMKEQPTYDTLREQGWKHLGSGANRSAYRKGDLVLKFGRGGTRQIRMGDSNYAEFIVYRALLNRGDHELFNPTWAYAELGKYSFVLAEYVPFVGEFDDHDADRMVNRVAEVLDNKYKYFRDRITVHNDVAWDLDIHYQNIGRKADGQMVVLDYGTSIVPIRGATPKLAKKLILAA